jgi:hypothetical protein
MTMAKKTKPEAPRGAKTAAIRQTLIANPTKTAKEIVELLKEQGFSTTPNYVGALKTKMGKKRKKKAKAVAPAIEPAAPAVPKDAVSIGLLQKAKKLAAQLGGIKEAKLAVDALSQLMD